MGGGRRQRGEGEQGRGGSRSVGGNGDRESASGMGEPVCRSSSLPPSARVRDFVSVFNVSISFARSHAHRLAPDSLLTTCWRYAPPRRAVLNHAKPGQAKPGPATSRRLSDRERTTAAPTTGRRAPSLSDETLTPVANSALTRTTHPLSPLHSHARTSPPPPSPFPFYSFPLPLPLPPPSPSTPSPSPYPPLPRDPAHSTAFRSYRVSHLLTFPRPMAINDEPKRLEKSPLLLSLLNVFFTLPRPSLPNAQTPLFLFPPHPFFPHTDLIALPSPFPR